MKNDAMTTQGVRLKIGIQQEENDDDDNNNNNNIGRFNNVWLYVDFASIRTIKNLHRAIRERFKLPKSRLFLQDFLLLPQEPIEILKDDDLIIVKNKKCEAHQNANRRRKILLSNDGSADNIANQKVENGIADRDNPSRERPKKKHKSNNFQVESNIGHHDTPPTKKRKRKHKKNNFQDDSNIEYDDKDSLIAERPKKHKKKNHNKNLEENCHQKIPSQHEDVINDIASNLECLDGREDILTKRKRKRTRRKRKSIAMEIELPLVNEDESDCRTREHNEMRFNPPIVKVRGIQHLPRNASNYNLQQPGRHIRFEQDNFDVPCPNRKRKIENGYQTAHSETQAIQHPISKQGDCVNDLPLNKSEAVRLDPIALNAHFAAKNFEQTGYHENVAATNNVNGFPIPVNVQAVDNCLVKSPSLAVYETQSNLKHCSITAVEPPCDYNTYPALNGCPRIGDTIAFQELILTEDYTPGISPYREGVVKFYDPKNDDVVVSLNKPLVATRLCGKFEIDEFDEEEKEEYITEVSRNMKSLLNPKLLKAVEILESK